MQKNLFFSIIIPYRNREILRVENCLKSLEVQLFQDFEVIFVDYGTEKPFQEKIEKIVKHFEKVQYIYADSRGMFWNRSQALNIGLYYAKGEFLVISDIDLIFENTFLKKTRDFLQNNLAFLYACTNFSEKYNKQDINKLFERLDKNSMNWYYGGGGNIVFKKEVLEKVGGYNEYYRVWGYEDIDFANRIEKLGIHIKKMPPESIVLHQEHPQNNLPKGWLHLGYLKLKNNNTDLLGMKEREKFCLKDRPSLKILLEKEFEKSMFHFDFPKEYHYSLFLKHLKNMKSNEFLYFKQNFENPVNQGKSWQKVLKWFNQIFEKIGFSYRLVNLKDFYEELILSETIHSFLFYLILENIHFEEWDYYYSYKNQEIEMIIYKR